MSIKKVYLKILIREYFIDNNQSVIIWNGRLKGLIKSVLEALKDLGENDLDFEKLKDLDYIISLYEQTKNEDLKDYLYEFPGMPSDIISYKESGYEHEIRQNYGFLTLIGYIDEEVKDLTKIIDGDFNFSFFVDTELFKIKMSYGEDEIYSDDFNHLIEIKDFIVENKVEKNSKELLVKNLFKSFFKFKKRDNILEYVSEQVKMINY